MLSDLRYEVEQIINDVESNILNTTIKDVTNMLRNLIDNIENKNKDIEERIQRLEQELDEYKLKEYI